MADYFVLDWDAKETIVGHVIDSSAKSLTNRLLRGRPLAADLTNGLEVRVEVAPEGEYPDYFTLQQIPIVSERLLSALRPFAQSVEIFPVPIIQRSTRVVTGHAVLNVVGRVACLDHSASELTFIDDDNDVILRVKKLMLDDAKTGKFDISRLHEFEPLILVSTQVRRAIDGLTGVVISPANGWSDNAWY